MRGTILCVITALVGAGAAWCDDAAKEAGEKDLKKLQGTWRFISQEMDGKARPAEQVEKLTITFTGDKWSVRENDKLIQAGTHKLDPTRKPAQLDAPVKEGEGKDCTMLGIYELKGDTLKVCFDPQGKERPTSFSAKAGQFAAVVQREKKKQ